MRRILWSSLDRSLDNRRFFFRGDLLGATTTMPVLDHSGQSVAFIAPPPQQNRRQRGCQVSRKNMVGRSISGTQEDVDAKSDSDWCVAMAADGLQLSTFRVSKDEPGRRWERHTISMRPPITLVKTFQIQETRLPAGNPSQNETHN